jgi:dTDP-4-dehydrorhamnose reductase
MKIVITGAAGQLGKELTQLFEARNYDVFPFDKKQLDITNQASIKQILEDIKPDFLINTAAFTQVDTCETEIEKAYFINGIGPYYLACEAKVNQVKFFHISTDYVFNGEKTEPYLEEDHLNPKTIYGKSKDIGETLALAANKNTTIIRTSWLYGHDGKNFVKTIKKLAHQAKEIRVVCDQFGSPTYTKDLAVAIEKLLLKPHGIYHVTNTGSCSWYEFAKEIVTTLHAPTSVIPVSTEEYGLQTPRPKYTVLSHKKLNSTGIFLRNWKEGLYEFLKKEADRSEN